MEEIGSRLKQMIDDMGLNASEFSDRVGIQRSSLSHLFSGRNKPSIDFIIKLKNAYPETDLEWLITGNKAQVDETSKIKESKNDGIAREADVTNVNNDSLNTDNEVINNEAIHSNKSDKQVKEIESIVWFYSDGSFKEYKSTPNSLDS